MADEAKVDVPEALQRIYDQIGVTTDDTFWLEVLAGVKAIYNNDLAILRKTGLKFELVDRAGKQRPRRDLYYFPDLDDDPVKKKYVKIDDPSINSYLARAHRMLIWSRKQEELTEQLRRAANAGDVRTQETLQLELVLLDEEMEKAS